MVNRIKLLLSQEEYSALIKIATIELRTPDAQALFLVRQKLIKCGLLEPKTTVSIQEPKGEPHATND